MGGHIKIGGQPFDDTQDFQPSAQDQYLSELRFKVGTS